MREGGVMDVELSTVQKLNLTDLMGEPHKLDPITVILEDLGPNRGKIIIECYGESWSAFWGSMGRSIAEFFCRCDEHYLANKLSGISGDVPDYDALSATAQKEVCRLRRDNDLTKSKARDLFDDAGRFSDAESAYDLDESAMREIFGDDWWHAIPSKPNPQYQYLCRVIKAVQAGIKNAGLLAEKVA